MKRIPPQPRQNPKYREGSVIPPRSREVQPPPDAPNVGPMPGRPSTHTQKITPRVTQPQTLSTGKNLPISPIPVRRRRRKSKRYMQWWTAFLLVILISAWIYFFN